MRRIVRYGSLALGLLIVATAGVAWMLYARITGNIRTDEAATQALDADRAARPRALRPGAQNILVMGSDKEGNYGSERADTTFLLHLSADRSRVAMVSVPRDLMVSIPSCREPGGGRSRAQYAQFNWAFQFGGSACSIRTFEDLTGVRVDHHLVVDFSGFERIVNAVGGVDVKVPQSMTVPDDTLVLKPGEQHLNGHQSLVFVRARTGVGDGSDLQRIERQKQFMRDLLERTRSGGMLAKTTRMYPVLNAVTQSLTADPGLDSLDEMYSLVDAARRIRRSSTSMVNVPAEDHPEYWGRLRLIGGPSKALFKALREDRPLAKVDGP
ncbi:LCP family protein [Streptomyces beijiangensis]|uniref:LCP family protein n=2 Tax=Streptomyces beijiangensis TaxID=163361 RepID=A0A939F4I3_9ACTN|nr:LCP family protein [Streptomyces beijiangensis]MBO0511751.1 LCP family protein [Streptomyces beijiangensis]